MSSQPHLRSPRRTIARPEGKTLSRPQLNVLRNRMEADRLKWRQAHGQAELLEMFKRMTESEYQNFLRGWGVPDRLQ